MSRRLRQGKPRSPDGVSRARRIAFNAVAGLVGLFAGLAGCLTVVSAMSSDRIVHRIHDLGPGLVLGLLLAPAAFALVGARHRSIAASHQMAAVAAALLIASALSGGPPAFVVVLAGLAVLPVLLHPHRRWLMTRSSRPRWGLAAVWLACAPFLIRYAMNEGRFQRVIAPTDSHAAEDHYVGMATAALSMLLVALVAVFSEGGWRLPAWCAALTAIALGVASVEAPRLQGSFGRIGGAAAVLIALTFALGVELHAHSDRPPEEPRQPVT